MPTGQELRSYYKRMLHMLKEVEAAEDPGLTLKRHIRAIEIEMDAEDVAYVNEKMKQK